METLKRKLSSRKLWAAVVGVITGLAMIFGLDADTVSTVAGAVVSAASVIAYITTEGKVDAAAAGSADDTTDASSAITYENSGYTDETSNEAG